MLFCIQPSATQWHSSGEHPSLVSTTSSTRIRQLQLVISLVHSPISLAYHRIRRKNIYSKLYYHPSSASSASQPCTRSAPPNLTNLTRSIVPAHEPQRRPLSQASELTRFQSNLSLPSKKSFRLVSFGLPSTGQLQQSSSYLHFIHPSQYTPTVQSASSSIVTVLRYKFCTMPTVYRTFLCRRSHPSNRMRKFLVQSLAPGRR
jgi:hypothetical protein